MDGAKPSYHMPYNLTVDDTDRKLMSGLQKMNTLDMWARQKNCRSINLQLEDE
jgi:hypothetical protein